MHLTQRVRVTLLVPAVREIRRQLASGIGKRTQLEANAKAVQADSAQLRSKLTFRNMIPSFILFVTMMAIYWWISGVFDGEVVALLPFETISFFRGVTHRGIAGENFYQCSVVSAPAGGLCTGAAAALGQACAAHGLRRASAPFAMPARLGGLVRRADDRGSITAIAASPVARLCARFLGRLEFLRCRRWGSALPSPRRLATRRPEGRSLAALECSICLPSSSRSRTRKCLSASRPAAAELSRDSRAVANPDFHSNLCHAPTTALLVPHTSQANPSSPFNGQW